MCTAIGLQLEDAYFGRNLDLEGSFGERAVITPRNFRLQFRLNAPLVMHYAMVGMARVADGYPLYAEAMNEKGVAMAGLNFPFNAVYENEPNLSLDNVAPFEVIPWILGQAGSLKEAKTLCERLCVVGVPFSQELPLTPLHWLISDGKASLVLETMAEGVRIYENPVNTLTNNPPFLHHLASLASFCNLTNKAVSDAFSAVAGKTAKGLGNGARGLPGDFSSPSRFIRAAWLLRYCTGDTSGSMGAHVGRVFEILSSVAPIKGCVLSEEERVHYTVYSCCANLTRRIFYLKTEADPQIRQVRLAGNMLDSHKLIEPVLEIPNFEKEGRGNE